MKNIIVEIASGYIKHCPFTNVHNSGIYKYGDVTMIRKWTEEDDKVWTTYGEFRLGTISAVHEWHARNPGTGGNYWYFGEDEEASRIIAGNPKTGRCASCGYKVAPGEYFCEDCRKEYQYQCSRNDYVEDILSNEDIIFEED